MRVLVTGGTGFIGRALVEKLTTAGHEVRLLTRRDLPAPDQPLPMAILAGVDAVVNMAGESIAGGRWTESYKQKIRDSRIILTKKLAAACVVAATGNTAAHRSLLIFPPSAIMALIRLWILRKTARQARAGYPPSLGIGKRRRARYRRKGFGWLFYDWAWFSVRVAFWNVWPCHSAFLSADRPVPVINGFPGFTGTM